MRMPARLIRWLGTLLAALALAGTGVALTASPAPADATSETETSSMTVERCTPGIDSACSSEGVIVAVDGQTITTTKTGPANADGAVEWGTGATAPSTTGSGNAAASSAATVNPADGTTAAAAPVGLTEPVTTLTAASAAALPDTGGSGTVLVMACVFLLLCGAAALALVHSHRREQQLP